MVLPDYKAVLDRTQAEINQRIRDPKMLRDARQDKNTLIDVLNMIEEYTSDEVGAAERANSQ